MFHRCPRGFAHADAQGLIGHELAEAVGEVVDAVVAEEAVFAIVDEFVDGGRVPVADGRQSHAHGFGEGEAEAFVGAREGENVAGAQDALDILRAAFEEDAVRQMMFFDQRLEFVCIAFLVLRAPEFDLPIRERVRDLRECLDEEVRALVVFHETADEEDLVRRLCSCEVGRRVVLRHDVADDGDARLGDVREDVFFERRQEHLAHGALCERRKFARVVGVEIVFGVAVRHGDDGDLRVERRDEHHRCGCLEGDDDVGPEFVEDGLHVVFEIVQRKVVVDGAPFAHVNGAQEFALDFERCGKQDVLAAKMAQVVACHARVDGEKERTFAVIAVDGRDRMAAPRHLIRERAVHLREPAAVAGHFRKIRQEDAHGGLLSRSCLCLRRSRARAAPADASHARRDLRVDGVEEHKALAVLGALARRDFFHRLARLDERELVKARIIRLPAARFFPERAEVGLELAVAADVVLRVVAVVRDGVDVLHAEAARDGLRHIEDEVLRAVTERALRDVLDEVFRVRRVRPLHRADVELGRAVFIAVQPEHHLVQADAARRHDEREVAFLALARSER